MRRTFFTLVLCLTLLAVGLVAPASGSLPAPAPLARVETLTGLEVPEAAELALQERMSGRVRALLSRPTATPIPFSMVGLGVPPEAHAELRTSLDGRNWSEWTEVHADAEEGPDIGSAEVNLVASAPVWVGAARHVQTRVEGASPEQVAVHVVDSAGLSRGLPERVADTVRAAWAGTPRQALAAPEQPVIRDRASWGAAPARGEPSLADRVVLGFVHHTAQSNNYSPGDVPAILQGIQAYQMDVRGFSDMGYNLMVDRFGTIWEGRSGGVDATVIGAQAQGFNSGSFGVGLIGDFSAAAPADAMVDALVDLLAWKFDVHHVDVTGEVERVSGGSNRYASGAAVRLDTLSGHRDGQSTECPGGLVYDLLPALRSRVADQQGPVLLDHTAEPDAVRVVEGASLDGALTFRTRLRPAGAWTLEVLDPSGVVVHADRGDGELASSTWTPAGVARGTYTYRFSADGRRAAEDAVELAAPTVEDVEVPASVTARDGGTAEPVPFRALLWPDADWSLTVTGEQGEVFSAAGSGERLGAEWDGAGVEPGVYGWTITADDVEPLRGEVRVTREALQRLATAGDAVADAVELSRAAFPDDGSAASAVLARADVFADAMAGGPLAGDGGSLLLTGSDQLDPRALTELDRVLPESATVYVLGGEEALAPAVVDALAGRPVARVGGLERTETAARIAALVVERSGTRTALVARADGGPAPWADALAGGAYGADRGVPVLLTDSAELSEAAAAAIADLGLDQTVVLGGTEAVGSGVEQALPNARRVWGPDRAGTAAAIARELWGDAGEGMMLVEAYREDAWTLPLAATPLAAREGAPLYVTAADELPPATADALRALAGGDVTGWVLGGDDRVAPAVAEEAAVLLE